MDTGPIVVTNDDGIDSPGIARLIDALDPLGEVIVVAPSSNQSAVGRAIDASATIEEHPLGIAVDGSPATCVVAATSALDLDPAVIVSGINKGANLGTSILGRSGTIGAAVEAAHLQIPSIAVSAYVPFERIQGDFHGFNPAFEAYSPAAIVARQLAEWVLEAGGLPDEVDYLNVNAPLTDDLVEPLIRFTRPADGYHTIAEREGDHLELYDRQFELVHTGELSGDLDTDRGTLSQGQISISPMQLPEQPLDASARQTVGHMLFGTHPVRLAELTPSGVE